MKRQFIHDLFSSFSLWFDHTLLSEGEAYTNTSGKLYNIKDSILTNYTVYSSPFKQWVYDSSINGAIIPSGVFVGSTFVPRGSNGLKLDFTNGRAVWPSGSPNWNVSGAYSVKDFNIYTTTRSDEELIFNNKFVFNPEFPQNLTGIPAGKIVAPAIFLKMTNFSNEAFEFGGIDNSKVNARAIILSDSEYSLDGVGNIFADKKYKNFPLFSKTPLTEFNDLKSGVYNYNDYVSQYFNYAKLPYISEVGFSKLLSVGVKDIDPDLRVGFLDFTIDLPRVT